MEKAIFRESDINTLSYLQLDSSLSSSSPPGLTFASFATLIRSTPPVMPHQVGRSSLATALLLVRAAAYIQNGTVVIPGASSYNGLNLTPQMGWDNWNAFGCDVSEDLLLSTADAMVDYGLRDLGYNYVILDDCWSAGRNQYRIQEANPIRFPST